MATINLYRDMQKALLGEQKKAKVQPFRTPTSMTKEQSAAHIMSKLLDAWKDKQAKEERVADTSQAMEMARAYNAPQAAYDPDKYGTDPRQILTGEKQLDAYQSSLGETPAPSAGIDRNTSLAIADPSLKGASPYEPGDEPVGDVAGLEVQKQNLINDAVRQQGSFQKENPVGMARVDQDFGGDVEKGPVSQRMLLALMGREDENKRAAAARTQDMETFEKKKIIEAKYRDPKPDKYGTPFVVADKNSSTGYSRFQINQAGARRILGEAPAPTGYPGASAPLEKGEKPSILKAPRTPWDSVPPRDRGRMQISVRKAATSLLNSESKALQESNLVANRLKRFKYLNSIEETGGLMDRVTDVSVDEQKREMVSIVDNLTPLMRQGLPGAASERDTAMFRGATVGINKTKAINDNIIAGQAALNQMGKDRLAFRQEYLQVNGHLEGSEKMWISYAEANPIFDFSAPEGSYKLNKNRKSYNDFFYRSDNKVRVVDY